MLKKDNEKDNLNVEIVVVQVLEEDIFKLEMFVVVLIEGCNFMFEKFVLYILDINSLNFGIFEVDGLKLKVIVL